MYCYNINCFKMYSFTKQTHQNTKQCDLKGKRFLHQQLRHLNTSVKARQRRNAFVTAVPLASQMRLHRVENEVISHHHAGLITWRAGATPINHLITAAAPALPPRWTRARSRCVNDERERETMR